MTLSKQVVLLDLETTGLSPKQHQIICIGLTYLNEKGGFETDHWFLAHPNEEACLLQKLLTFLSDYKAIFTYNGRGFEFPFIKARLSHYGLDTSPFLKLKLIDMKLTLKAFCTKRSKLENLFHFKRQCQSSGQDIVRLYRTYIQTKDEIYKACILAHQKEELLSLALFFELYMTLYQIKDWTLVTQKCQDMNLVLSIQHSSCFTADFKGIFKDICLTYHQNESFFNLTFPLFKGKLARHLEPVKDYYYIESQNELMHKSLIQFMPKNLIRKATKAECVIYKEGTFIPIFSDYKMTFPLWHDESNHLYLEYKDFSLDILQIQLFYFFFSTQKR